MLKSIQKSLTLDLLFLTALSLFFLQFRLGSGSLASWDESLYAQVAKEMFRDGHFFRLTLGGGVWVDKPPLAMWFTALFYALFGVSEWTARLFSSLCGVGLVLTTYWIGRLVINRWVGFLSALVLLSSADFLRFSRFGMLDIPLTLFISLSLLFFWLARHKEHFYYYSCAFMVLALWTKSLSAIFIPIVMLSYALLSDERYILKRASFWKAIGLAALFYLPWILIQVGSPVTRESFIQENFVKHIFGRSFVALEGHDGHIFYYARALLNKYHPWIIVAIASIPLFIYRSVKDKLSEITFLTVWMWSIFLIISLMKTKLRWYVLPVYPPLSISCGYALAYMIHEKHKAWVMLGSVAVMGLHVYYSKAIFNPDYSHDIKRSASVVRLLPTASVYLYNFHEQPAGLFYWDKKIMYVDDLGSLVSAIKQNPQMTLYVPKKYFEDIKDILKKENFQTYYDGRDAFVAARGVS